MKVGDLVRCKRGTEDCIWWQPELGLVVSLSPNNWGDAVLGSTHTYIVTVLWASGKELAVSTRWLEVVNVEADIKCP